MTHSPPVNTRMTRSAVTRVNTAMRFFWALAAAVVAVGSLLPASSPVTEALGHISDRLMHFFAYALLAFVPALHEDRLRTAAFAVASAALGITLEFAQRYSPGRKFEIADIVSDVAGVICGVAVGYAVRAGWRKRSAAVASIPKPHQRRVLLPSDANEAEEI